MTAVCAKAACALVALPAMLVGAIMGEPDRHRPPAPPAGVVQAVAAYFSPLVEFLRRRGALVVLLFVLIHKIGDTLANLTLRLLFEDLGFTNDEVAFYDVGVGFVALLAGVFVGGTMYASMGMKRSVFVSLVLMAVSNFSFAALAAYGHSNLGMAGAIGFENFASGIGGVAVVAYLSALCNLRFTATQYALLSALASIAGRFLTGTTPGSLIEAMDQSRSVYRRGDLARESTLVAGRSIRCHHELRCHASGHRVFLERQSQPQGVAPAIQVSAASIIPLTREFANRVDHNLCLYRQDVTYAQLNLLDSHDTPRFLSCVGGDKASLRLAWLFMFTYPGAPCIYYGDEIGLDGEHDPYCRKSFPWDEIKWDISLHAYLKQLIALRKKNPVLRRGDYKRLWSADEVYAFSRTLR